MNRFMNFAFGLLCTLALTGFAACGGSDDDDFGQSGGNNSNDGNTVFVPERTVDVKTAGTLPELISEADMYKIKSLKLTGVLNGTDIRMLRKMMSSNTGGMLTKLDISNAKIVEGGEQYIPHTYTDYLYRTNYDILGERMFYQLRNLETIILPKNIKGIERHCFSECTSLKKIAIPASVKTINTSSFSSCQIEVYLHSNKTKINSINFSGDGNRTSEGATLYVPRGNSEYYMGFKPYFKDIIEYDL